MGPTTFKLPRRLSIPFTPRCLLRPFGREPERTKKTAWSDTNDRAFGSCLVVIPTGTSPAEIWNEISRRFPSSEAKPSLDSPRLGTRVPRLGGTPRTWPILTGRATAMRLASTDRLQSPAAVWPAVPPPARYSSIRSLVSLQSAQHLPHRSEDRCRVTQ